MNTLEVFICPIRGVVYLDLKQEKWFNVTSDGITPFTREESESSYSYVGEVKKDKLKEMFFLLTVLGQKNMLEGYCDK